MRGESLNVCAPTQAIFELVYDFFPNYNFNSITNRFVRSPIRGGDVPRESMPKPKNQRSPSKNSSLLRSTLSV